MDVRKAFGKLFTSLSRNVYIKGQCDKFNTRTPFDRKIIEDKSVKPRVVLFTISMKHPVQDC